MRYQRTLLSLATGWAAILLGVVPAAFPSAVLAEQPECSIEDLEARFSKGGGLGVGTAPAKRGDFEKPIFLKVRAVETGGPADEAGLRVDDGIYAVNGIRLEATEEGAEFFGTLHRDLKVGDTVVYTVLRHGSKLDVEMVAKPRTAAVVRYFVHTHLAFNRCEKYREYGRQISGLPVLQG